VWWVAGTVVGFALITAGVVALARNSTASWEAESRAHRAAPAPPGAGSTARRRTELVRTELVRTVAAAGVAAVHAGRALGAAGALVVATPKRLLARIAHRQPSPSVDSAAAEHPQPVPPRPARARRRALALVHRHRPHVEHSARDDRDSGR
jgi:hypothetical protein